MGLPTPCLALPRWLGTGLKVSSRPFMPPTVVSGAFIYAAPASTLKWVARVRSGGLATRARLAGSGMLTSAQCLCCSAPVEDDAHAISEYWCCGLPADGGVSEPVVLPSAWVSAHLLQLATGLIPLSISTFLGGTPAWLISILLRDLQQGMLGRLAPPRGADGCGFSSSGGSGTCFPCFNATRRCSAAAVCCGPPRC